MWKLIVNTVDRSQDVIKHSTAPFVAYILWLPSLNKKKTALKYRNKIALYNFRFCSVSPSGFIDKFSMKYRLIVSIIYVRQLNTANFIG